MSTQQHATTPPVRPTLSRRKLWILRGMAIAFPFVAFGLLEIGVRATDRYRDGLFAEGVQFFPEWDQLESPKPADRGRLFVVGGSSAWGFGVDEPFGLLLQRRLKQAAPDRRWEVVNGGVPAYGSHRVLEIVRRACRFEPDLIVVYIGHNEFLEEVFYDPQGLAARAEGAQRFARRSQAVRWLGELFGVDSYRPRPKLQQHFLGNSHFPLIKSREQYASRLDFLKSNVRQMILACRESGTPILFIPEVTNLLEPPGDPAHGAVYDPSGGDWNLLRDQTVRELGDADWEALLDSATAVVAQDPEYAEAYYWRGRALLGLGREEEGLAALQVANLKDWRGDRANADICAAIIETCSAQGAPYLDIRKDFWEHLKEEHRRLVAKEPLGLFLDHCHPTEAGHRLIAEACGPLVLSLVAAEGKRPASEP